MRSLQTVSMVSSASGRPEPAVRLSRRRRLERACAPVVENAIGYRNRLELLEMENLLGEITAAAQVMLRAARGGNRAQNRQGTRALGRL